MKPLSTTIERCTETVGQRNEIDDVMTLTLIIQRIFGQQILNPNWTWKRFFFHHTLSACLIIYVSFGTYEILKNTNDVKLIAEACYTFIVIAMYPLKYLIFVSNRKTFRNLYTEVKTTFFMLIKDDSIDKVQELLLKAKKMMYALFSMVVFPVLFYISTAIYFYIEGDWVTLSKTTSVLMPMASPYYEIGSFFHAVFLIQVSCTVIMVDMWFVFLLYFYCTVCDSVLKTLQVEGRRENENGEDYAKRLNNCLGRFYSAHVNQSNYLNTLNKMFKWLALVPLLNVTLCTCILLLVMSKEIDWKFTSNMLPTFAEIFAYNWFGEQIKTKAHELYKALLSFDWVNLRQRDRRNYYIIVFYMSKEFGIKTAVGNDLSLITMSAVLKASYQAFTVLQSLDN